MITLKLTKAHFCDTQFYYKEYVGQSLDGFNGNIEIDEDLGWLNFKETFRVSGYIFAKSGAGIKADSGIEAGEWIKAKKWIKAGEWIKAGFGIESGGVVMAGSGIEIGGVVQKI